MGFEPTEVTMQNPGVTPLEVFKQKAAATKERVETRLNEQYKLLIQEKCIIILEKVNKKLEERVGAKVRITYYGHGNFGAGDEEVNVNGKDVNANINVNLEQLVEVIDQIDAYSRGDIAKTVHPWVEVWFSEN